MRFAIIAFYFNLSKNLGEIKPISLTNNIHSIAYMYYVGNKAI